MLVLKRKRREVILIGDNVRVIVQRIGENCVNLAIDAPRDVRVMREEINTETPKEAA